jgi:serine/threonine protein kinase
MRSVFRVSEPGRNPAELHVGDVVAGKYRIERALGAGGMGVVVAAMHLDLDQRVAIKFLRPEALANPEAVARFSREAKASARIRGEHVARTLDVARLEDGTPYMVIEYLDGYDLASRLSRKGPLPIDRAVEFVLQACEAIAEAHVLGIVHRDLKPANLYVIRRPDGSASVKVLDFGISKLAPRPGSVPDGALTSTSSLMGSPLYMAPEQMHSARKVDHRSDIWALGVTLYELLAGKPPFDGDTVPELCAMVLTKSAPSLATVRPDVPPEIVTVVDRCLVKDPGGRYQNVAELAWALAAGGHRKWKAAAERVSRIAETGAQAPSTSSVEMLGDVAARAQSEKTDSALNTATTAAHDGSPGRGRRSVALGVAVTALIGAVVLLGYAIGKPGQRVEVQVASSPPKALPSTRPAEAPIPEVVPVPTAPPVISVAKPVPPAPAPSVRSAAPPPPAPVAAVRTAAPLPLAVPDAGIPKPAARPAPPAAVDYDSME